MCTNRPMLERLVDLVKLRIFKTFVTTLAIAGLGAGAAVSTAAQDATTADDTETRQHAVENIRLLFAALNSEQVDGEIKNVLVGCIYQNSMQEITVAMDKAIAANPEELDRTDTGAMLGLMAGICGFQPEPTGEAPAQPR